MLDLFSPPGFFRCLINGSFIKPNDVCNGIYNCPNGYDEMFCGNFSCPLNCQCNRYYSLTCTGNIEDQFLEEKIIDFKSLTLFQSKFIKRKKIASKEDENFQLTFLKILDSFVQENVSLKFLENIRNLKILIIENNNIKYNDFQIGFNFPKYLQTLKIVNFQLMNIKIEKFKYLNNLKILDFSQNHINFIDNSLFDNMKYLLEINLTFNKLNFLSKNFLIKQKHLKNLYLEKNSKFDLMNINFLNIKNLKSLEYLSVENEYFCCNLFHGKYFSNCKWLKRNILKNCLNLFNSIFLKFQIIIQIFIIFISFLFYFYYNYVVFNRKIHQFVSSILLHDFIFFSFLIEILYLNSKNEFFQFYPKWQNNFFCKFMFFSLYFNIVWSNLREFLSKLSFQLKYERRNIFFNNHCFLRYISSDNLSFFLTFSVITLKILLLKKNEFFYKNLLWNPVCHPFLSNDNQFSYEFSMLILIFNFLLFFTNIIFYQKRNYKKILFFTLKHFFLITLTILLFFQSHFQLDVSLNFIASYHFFSLNLFLRTNVQRLLQKKRENKLEKQY